MKKEDINESLQMLQLGHPVILIDKKGHKKYAQLCSRFIRVAGFGQWAIRNTEEAWEKECKNMESLKVMPKDFCVPGAWL